MTAPPDPSEALLDELERWSGVSGLAFAEAPRPLRGGLWARLYVFRLANPPPGLEGTLVLRAMPDALRARREIVIQDTLARLGFSTPSIRLAGEVCDAQDAARGLGAAFSVMDRAPGGSVVDGLTLAERLRALRRMPDILARTMLRLHALRCEPVEEALLRSGLPRDALSLEELIAEIQRAAERIAFADGLAALAWLQRREPAPSKHVVCHGDLHAYNVVLARDAVTALVDWTNARIAAPEHDVAYTAQLLGQLPIDVPRWIGPLKDRIGERARLRFLAAYARGHPIDAARLRWHGLLHALRLLVRVAEARHPDGALAPLARSHPWEIAAEASRATFVEATGVPITLPASAKAGDPEPRASGG